MTASSDGKKPSGKIATISKPTEPIKNTDMLDAVEGQSHSNIEKIRSILFGNQMRDYETRFVRLEEQLSKDVADLREEIRRRNDAIESYVRQELEALSERLAGEYEGRASSLKEVNKSLDELSSGLDERSHQLEEQLSKSNRELRQQVLTQSKQIRDELQLGLGDLTALVQRELQQLRGSKTDRTALAGLLTELASRLGSDGT
jgi:DNA repair exonuclease SbcCD ATPase subunit